MLPLGPGAHSLPLPAAPSGGLGPFWFCGVFPVKACVHKSAGPCWCISRLETRPYISTWTSVFVTEPGPGAHSLCLTAPSPCHSRWLRAQVGSDGGGRGAGPQQPEGPVLGRARWPEVLQRPPPALRGQGSPTSHRSQHIPIPVSSRLPLNSAPTCALWPAHLPSGAGALCPAGRVTALGHGHRH